MGSGPQSFTLPLMNQVAASVLRVTIDNSDLFSGGLYASFRTASGFDNPFAEYNGLVSIHQYAREWPLLHTHTRSPALSLTTQPVAS
jgi:hypothetical protein